MIRRFIAVVTAASLFVVVWASRAGACEDIVCPVPDPEVAFTPGSLTASSVSGSPGERMRTATTVPSLHTYTLLTPCQFTDPREGGCLPGDFTCPQVPDRLIVYYYVLSQRLVQEDRREIDGLTPGAGDAVGTTYGPPVNEGPACVDITDLNPPPSPGEVFRYFQTLPLPQLTTRQQPPGNGLVGLPVIFYTDSPTTQTFTLDIRGFTVVIAATATGYTWHTGDGTELTSTDPGRPYPDHTVTHDYRAGTYTASLTTTWSATFTVDGGAPADVPGTTTTDGPPVTFTVLQARPVLTNPYD
jgi:hypothetical protein